MTLNWTTERPKKPGDYWFSLPVANRVLFASPDVVRCVVFASECALPSLHVSWMDADGCCRILSLQKDKLDGALWAPRETPADPFAKPEPKQYVILDTRQIVGNCAMFWRPDGAGYTCDLNDAGLYEKTKGRRDTDIYVPIEVARSMAVTHVRVEPLKRAGYWSKPQPKDTRPQRCEGCSRFVKRGGWLCAKCAEKGW